jgi:hypothetical protein
MAFNIFSLALHTKLGFPHPIVHGFSWCICGQTINLIRIHLFYYVHGGNRITTHDVVWNSFAFIARKVRFQVLCKQTHVLSMPSL